MDKPALLGGSPATHPTAWPQWPQWNGCEAAALQQVLASGHWQAGPQVEAFEQAFAHYQMSAHAVCVTNGTTSLELALRALGVGPGHEVIVPSYTFAATALAVLTVGARPVFVDIQEETLNVDPAAVAAAIGDHTRAVMPVHIGGHPVDLEALLALTKAHDLAVVEDAAHAHGAEWCGQRIGTAGDCASFSFQTGKSITSGDGGCLTTDDAELAERFRSLRNFGRSADGTIVQIGSNHRMTEFQAAVLRCALGRLDEQISHRQRNVMRLREILQDIPGVRPAEPDLRVTRHPYYQVILKYDPKAFGLDKLTLLKALAAEGIPFEGGYEPLHRLPVFKHALEAGSARCLPCPVAEQAADHTALWLSFRMALADEAQMETIGQALHKLHTHSVALRRHAGTEEL